MLDASAMLSKHVLAILGLVILASVGCKERETPAADNSDQPLGTGRYGLSAAQASEVLAEVGDRTITVGEFVEGLGPPSAYLRTTFQSPERLRTYVEGFVNAQLYSIEASRRGYDTHVRVVGTRDTAMGDLLVEHEVTDKVKANPPTEKEIRSEYDKDPGAFARGVTIRYSDILIKSQPQAEKLLDEAKQLDSVDAFKTLAVNRSQDEAARHRGGESESISVDSFRMHMTPILGAVFALQEEGSVVPELVQDEKGFHILMLTHREVAHQPSFEQAEATARDRVTHRKTTELLNALSEQIRRETNFQVNYDVLKKVQISGDDSDMARRSTVFATVGTKTFTVGDLEDLARRLNRAPQNSEQLEAFAKSLLKKQMFAQAAERRGYGDDPRVKRRVDRIKVTVLLEELDAQFRVDQVSNEEVRAYYEEHLAEFISPVRRRASHILVDDEKEAAALIEELRGADLATFQRKAKQLSLDVGTRSRGGDLSLFTEDGKPGKSGDPRINMALVQAVYALEKVGDITPQSVEIPGTGWSVAILQEIQPSHTMSLDFVRDGIRNAIWEARKKAARQALLSQLQAEFQPDAYPERVPPIDFGPVTERERPIQAL
jgi:peptidyl-prolyl cis-trans isomerase C